MAALKVHKTLYKIAHRYFLPFGKCSSKKCFFLKDHEMVKENIFSIFFIGEKHLGV